jgi:hypothetical protein
LAAGDFNECRSWDLTHPGRWGAHFFDRLPDLGLNDCLYSRWSNREVPTRGEYQIDHVLGTDAVEAAVIDPRVLSASELAALVPSNGEEALVASDHLPIVFTVSER